MTLQLVPTRPDLPPFWDGVPVEWSEWSQARSTLILHAPPETLACDQCGTVDEVMINFGKRPPEKPTFTTTRTKTTKSGHKYGVPAEVKSWPVRDIYAARCRHCGHDRVTDLRTDEVWDLDESDYAPEGSYEHADTLF